MKKYIIELSVNIESGTEQSTQANYITSLLAENKAYEEENEKLGRQQEEFINEIVQMEEIIDGLKAELAAMKEERDESDDDAEETYIQIKKGWLNNGDR